VEDFLASSVLKNMISNVVFSYHVYSQTDYCTWKS